MSMKCELLFDINVFHIFRVIKVAEINDLLIFKRMTQFMDIFGWQPIQNINS